MGIFDRIRKASSPPEQKKEEPKKAKAPAVKTVDAVPAAAGIGGNSARLLVTPRVSEKAARLASKGTYVFNVPTSANKVEIAKAVEALYKVSVVSVRTNRGIGKIMNRGRIWGRRVNWKKALVTIKEGQKLDLYEGV